MMCFTLWPLLFSHSYLLIANSMFFSALSYAESYFKANCNDCINSQNIKQFHFFKLIFKFDFYTLLPYANKKNLNFMIVFPKFVLPL